MDNAEKLSYKDSDHVTFYIFECVFKTVSFFSKLPPVPVSFYYAKIYKKLPVPVGLTYNADLLFGSGKIKRVLILIYNLNIV